MAGIDLGTAFLQIVPSFRDGLKEGFKEAEAAGQQMGKKAGDSFAGDFGKQATPGIKKGVDAGAGEAAKSTKKTGGAAGESFADGFSVSAEKGGEKAGGKMSKALGGALAGAAVVAAAAGAAAIGAFTAAMDRQGDTAKAAAQLGLNPQESKEQGALAGKIYSQAYGESFSDVSAALADVSTQLVGLDKGELEGATKNAMNFASAFDVDVTDSIQSVSTLMKSGLVSSADEAFDLLTASSQKVPAALRGPIMDASDEYSQFFRAVGFDGDQAFSALVAGAAKGEFGIDKTGDAIKEFTIRSTDMSTTSVAAYEAIGLNAGEMSNAILAGGDTAKGAFDKIVQGVLDIKDPTERSNTAIALFGTQMEDLGVQDIPKFLQGLQGTSGELGNVEGAAKRMDATLGGTMSSKLTALGRTFTNMGTTLAGDLLPLFGPAIDGLSKIASSVTERVGPALEKVPALFQSIGALVGPVFSQLKDTLLPVFEQVGAVLGPAFVDVFNALKPAIGQLLPVFSQLLPLFNPVGLLFKALLPVLPQIATLVGDVARMLGEFLAKALTALAPLFQAIVGVIGELIPFITQLVASLLPPLMSLFDSLAPLLQAVLDALLPLVTAIASALIPIIQALMPIVKTVFEFVASTIGNAIRVFQGLVDFVTGVLTGNWSKAWDGIKQIFGAIWDQIKNTLSTAWNFIVELITGLGPKVLGILQSFFGMMVEKGKQFLSWLWDGIKATAENVFKWFTSLPGWLWDKVFAALGFITERGKQFLSWLWDGIKTKAVELFQWFTSLPGWVWDRVKAAAQWVIDRGGQFIGWLKDGIVRGAAAIWTFFKELPGKAWNALVAIKDKILSIGKDFVGWVVEGIKSVASSIWDAITGALQGGSDASNPLSGGQAGVVFGGTSRGGVIPRAAAGRKVGFAAGGVVPGQDPGRFDNVLAALPNGKPWGLRSEEAVMVPEFTRWVGGERGVHAWNRLAEAGKLDEIFGMAGGYAAGGIVGTKAAASKLGIDMAWAEAKKLVDVIKSGAGGGTFVGNGQWGPVNMNGFAANTQAAKDYIEAHFPGVASIGGLYGGSVSGSDHPFGKALDVMIANYASQAGIAAGTNIANWFVANPNSFGTKYVIWRDRINQGGAWSPYSHPSGNNDTLAHRDHVHISFLTGEGAFSGTAGGATTGDVGMGISALAASVAGKLGFAFGGGSAAGPAGVSGGKFDPLVERWRPTVLQALGLTNQSPGLADTVLNQIRTESSGDPRAINLTDINAQRGDPSRGLIQAIMSTFQAYRLSSLPNDIYNPLSNIVAGIRYVLDRYGSVPAGMRGVAYDMGGDWPTGTTGINLTGGTEAVLTPSERVAYQTHAAALAAGFGGQVVHVELNGGDEISRIIARTAKITVENELDGEAFRLETIGARS